MADRQGPIQLPSAEADRVLAMVQAEVNSAVGAVTWRDSEVTRSRGYFQDTLQTEDKTIWEGSCKLRVPFVKTSLHAIEAEVRASLVDIDPLVHVEGKYAPWEPVSDDMERFHEVLGEDYLRFKQKVRRAMRMSLRDGSAGVVVSWKSEMRRVVGWEEDEIGQEPDSMDEMGNPVPGNPITERVATERDMLVYNAPWLEILPVEKYGVLPSTCHCVEESNGVFLKTRVSGDWLLQRVNDGDYGQDEVEDILSAHGAQELSPREDERRMGVGVVTETSSEPQDYANADVELTEVWRWYTPKGEKMPQRWVIVYHESSNTLLSLRPTPYWFDRWPLVVVRPYDDESEGIHGDSVATTGGGYVQDGKQALIRIMVDTAQRSVLNRTFVPYSFYTQLQDKYGNDAIDRFKLPGAIIPVPDSLIANSRAIIPIQDGSDPSSAIPIYELLNSEGEMATSASDQRKGSAGGVAKTAREAMILDSAGKKLMSSIRENFASAIRDIATLVHALLYQYADEENLEALWNQVNPPEVQSATWRVAMDGAYRFTANGLADETNRIYRAEQASERYGILMNEPVVASNADLRYTLLVETLRAKGERQPERFLGTQQEFMEKDAMYQMMQQLMAAQSAGTEQGGAAPASTFQTEQGGGEGNAEAPMPPLAGQDNIYKGV